MSNNISQDYVITNYAASRAEHAETNSVDDPGAADGVAASSVIEAIATSSASYDEGTITLIDHTGKSKTYIFDDDDDGATGTIDGSNNVRVQINGLSSVATIGAQLKAAIIGSTGHDGTITATRLAGVVTLVQSSVGASGNTDITVAGIAGSDLQVNSGGVSKFTSGANANTGLPFRLSVFGPAAIREQTTNSYYQTFIGEQRC